MRKNTEQRIEDLLKLAVEKKDQRHIQLVLDFLNEINKKMNFTLYEKNILQVMGLEVRDILKYQKGLIFNSDLLDLDENGIPDELESLQD